jgi:hypothetical protein
MRICTDTGLALIDTRLTGYRIAKSSYGPLTPGRDRISQGPAAPLGLASTNPAQRSTLPATGGQPMPKPSLIAQWIREQALDDGSYSAGAKFHSKFGGGTCWAYWMRRTDDGLGPEPVEIIAEDEIQPHDDDLEYVLNLYGASCR